MADDYGQISVYSLPKSKSYIKPSIIGTGELFPKNSRLLLESFTVYEFAIVAYVRRFEQRSNEIEHSKLIKAGLPIMKGEQVCFYIFNLSLNYFFCFFSRVVVMIMVV